MGDNAAFNVNLTITAVTEERKFWTFSEDPFFATKSSEIIRDTAKTRLLQDVLDVDNLCLFKL